MSKKHCVRKSVHFALYACVCTLFMVFSMRIFHCYWVLNRAKVPSMFANSVLSFKLYSNFVKFLFCISFHIPKKNIATYISDVFVSRIFEPCSVLSSSSKYSSFDLCNSSFWLFVSMHLEFNNSFVVFNVCSSTLTILSGVWFKLAELDPDFVTCKKDNMLKFR